ncbi:MAG: 3-hydroxyanthranilic acid dioxygenase [Bogoriella megaspora]|nr:MAG: 3-hydroxyanthranilic acid dioxygenase [Bogoriella megaspora]
MQAASAIRPLARRSILWTLHKQPICPRITAQRAAISTTTARLQELAAPLNIPKWSAAELSENSNLLQPPINNYCVNNESMTVMIIGGPNARTDYHINETPEWFYQYKGSMLLQTVDPFAPPSPNGINPSTGGAFKDIRINEGDIFLLPPNTPHNPIRFKDSVGVVIEQRRPETSIDRLRWYCNGCGEVVHEKSFYCTDLGTQLKAAVQAFENDIEARKCKKCGEVCEVKPKQT